MDCLTLLAEARESGLKVSANGDQLVIRGPKSASHIAEALISRKQEIMDLLSEMNTRNRQTFIIVTHSDEVAARAHRIIRMLDGRIVEDAAGGATSQEA